MRGPIAMMIDTEVIPQSKTQKMRVTETSIAKEFMTMGAILGLMIYTFVQLRWSIRQVHLVAYIKKMMVNFAIYFTQIPLE